MPVDRDQGPVPARLGGRQPRSGWPRSSGRASSCCSPDGRLRPRSGRPLHATSRPGAASRRGWPPRSTSAPAAGRRSASGMVDGEDRQRLSCEACGHIAYVNPRLVVTTLPIDDDGERRAHPARHRAGRRAVGPARRLPRGRRDRPPGGHPRDLGGDRAARRAGRDRRAVHAARGGGRDHRVRGPDRRRRPPAPTPEATEIQAYAPEAIPWPKIAFRTTTWALRDWLDLRHPASAGRTASSARDAGPGTADLAARADAVIRRSIARSRSRSAARSWRSTAWSPASASTRRRSSRTPPGASDPRARPEAAVGRSSRGYDERGFRGAAADVDAVGCRPRGGRPGRGLDPPSRPLPVMALPRPASSAVGLAPPEDVRPAAGPDRGPAGLPRGSWSTGSSRATRTGAALVEATFADPAIAGRAVAGASSWARSTGPTRRSPVRG